MYNVVITIRLLVAPTWLRGSLRQTQFSSRQFCHRLHLLSFRWISRVSVDTVHPSLLRSSSSCSPGSYHLQSLSSDVFLVSSSHVAKPPQSCFPAPLWCSLPSVSPPPWCHRFSHCLSVCGPHLHVSVMFSTFSLPPDVIVSHMVSQCAAPIWTSLWCSLPSVSPPDVIVSHMVSQCVAPICTSLWCSLPSVSPLMSSFLTWSLGVWPPSARLCDVLYLQSPPCCHRFSHCLSVCGPHLHVSVMFSSFSLPPWCHRFSHGLSVCGPHLHVSVMFSSFSLPPWCHRFSHGLSMCGPNLNVSVMFSTFSLPPDVIVSHTVSQCVPPICTSLWCSLPSVSPLMSSFLTWSLNVWPPSAHLCDVLFLQSPPWCHRFSHCLSVCGPHLPVSVMFSSFSLPPPDVIVSHMVSQCVAPICTSLWCSLPSVSPLMSSFLTWSLSVWPPSARLCDVLYLQSPPWCHRFSHGLSMCGSHLNVSVMFSSFSLPPDVIVSHMVSQCVAAIWTSLLCSLLLVSPWCHRFSHGLSVCGRMPICTSSPLSLPVSSRRR